MPQNWKTYKLIDIVDKSRGISYGVVQPGQHDPEGVPILKVNNLTNKTFRIEGLHHISTKVESKYLRTRLQGGELLVSLVGSLGEIYSVPNSLIGLNVVRALAVLPVKPEFSPKWVEYVLKSQLYQNKLEQIATSSVQKTINLKELREIEIPFPVKNERESIASILSIIDDKIELNLQQNKTLEEMAMSLYKHWFVDFGPFQDGEFIDSELGKIPKGWEVKRLENLADIGSSKRIFLKEYVENGIPFYRGKEVIQLSKGNSISTKLFIPESRFQEIETKFGVPKKGDILVSSVGTIGISWMVESNSPFYFKDGNLTWIKNYKSNFNGYFIWQWLKSSETQDQIKSETIGSTQQALTISALKQLRIIVPSTSSDLVETITEKLVIWNDMFLNNKTEIQTLTKLRDTLLPKLISGEARVKDVEQNLAQML